MGTTSVLTGARACSQDRGHLYPSYTHTYINTIPLESDGDGTGLLVHLQRKYNPSGLPVHGRQLQSHWAPCAFTGMHPHAKPKCHCGSLPHGFKPSQFSAIVVAALLRNYDPHIIRRPHIKTSFMIADTGAYICVCTCM